VDSLSFSDEKFKKLIETVKRCNPECKNLSTFITRIEERLVLETYINEGVDFELQIYASGRYRHGSRKTIFTVSKKLTEYDRHVINFFKKHSLTVEKSFETWYFKNPQKATQQIQLLSKAQLNDAQFERIIHFIPESSNWRTMTEEYHYDVKSLAEYLLNYIAIYEGLEMYEALQYLVDYYRMGKQMGRYADKYPKYLRSMHDIFSANFRSFKKEYDELLFKNMAKPELLWEHDGFITLIPEKSKDIVEEGTNLNHCVSSYVDRILAGETYIFFLRTKKEPEKSLVTLELREGRLTQARGAYNRAITEDEAKFLKRFIKEKKIETTLTV
jgi:hypothetical protein